MSATTCRVCGEWVGSDVGHVCPDQGTTAGAVDLAERRFCVALLSEEPEVIQRVTDRYVGLRNGSIEWPAHLTPPAPAEEPPCLHCGSPMTLTKSGDRLICSGGCFGYGRPVPSPTGERPMVNLGIIEAVASALPASPAPVSPGMEAGWPMAPERVQQIIDHCCTTPVNIGGLELANLCRDWQTAMREWARVDEERRTKSLRVVFLEMEMDALRTAKETAERQRDEAVRSLRGEERICANVRGDLLTRSHALSRCESALASSEEKAGKLRAAVQQVAAIWRAWEEAPTRLHAQDVRHEFSVAIARLAALDGAQ